MVVKTGKSSLNVISF